MRIHNEVSCATIHWLRQAAADVPAGDDWLAATESAMLAGLRISKRRRDWRLGRWTAKRAVALYLHVTDDALRRIEIRATQGGAPEVIVDRQPARLALSISHSTGVSVCAVAAGGVALGCDVETIEPRSEAFIADFFTDEERAVVVGTPALDQPRVATLMWSAKESALKALREGLRLDTRSVAVSVPEAGLASDWHPLSVCYATTGQVFHGWWRCNQDCVLTIVACPRPCLPVALVATV